MLVISSSMGSPVQGLQAIGGSGGGGGGDGGGGGGLSVISP